MSDFSRGAYTPPSNDAPLAFDARRPVRGGSPAPVTLIVSALVLIVLIAGAWFIYRDGFRASGEAPKAVGAVPQVTRTEPKAEDQPRDETRGLEIYNDPDSPGAPDPAFAPRAEEPLPRPPPPAPVAATAPVAAPTAASAAVSPPPAVKPAPVAAAPAKAPAPVSPSTAAKPVELKPSVPKPVSTTAAPPARSPGGTYLVQIGAFSSAALADKGWNDAAALAPGAAAGKGKKVETVASGGKTLFRTSVTGFASRADADAFCSRLKAARKDCFVR
ncbi:MAG: SPOR domain-containing protein [Caulobacter sp.]|jgi:hypothetical protein|nr:SPOR domain-containing protein [Caulobacter sp.]